MILKKFNMKNKNGQSRCNGFVQYTVKIEIAFTIKVRSNEKICLIENKLKFVVINLYYQKYLPTMYAQLLRYYCFQLIYF